MSSGQEILCSLPRTIPEELKRPPGPARALVTALSAHHVGTDGRVREWNLAIFGTVLSASRHLPYLTWMIDALIDPTNAGGKLSPHSVGLRALKAYLVALGFDVVRPPVISNYPFQIQQ